MHAGEAEGPYMMQRFRHQHFRMDPRRRYLYGRRPRAILYGRRRPRSWRRRVVGALMICCMLLIVSAVLGKARTPRTVDSSSSQMGRHTQVIIVKDDTLPPVMQRIAQCESRGQHFTKDGQVVRGKRNPHDTGLFQINTVVWGKKAEELGYDIRTQEGNALMARYLFENYGSVPWQSSAACWSRMSERALRRSSGENARSRLASVEQRVRRPYA